MKLLIGLLSVILFIVGCSNSRYSREFELDESTFDADAMQMVITDSGFNLPEGSRGLNFAYKPPIDPAFLARIEIPFGSEDLILKQIEGLKGDKMFVVGRLAKRVKWWHPATEKVLIDRQVFDNSRGATKRIVLTSERDKLILYIAWSS